MVYMCYDAKISNMFHGKLSANAGKIPCH